jgi:hypothetical protein
LEEIGLPTAVWKEEVAAVTRVSKEKKGEERKKEERGGRRRVSVQVTVSRANRTGATESRCLL